MRRLAAILLLALVAVPVARAGGEQTAVVATAGRVWVTYERSVFELDAASGRILHRVTTRLPYATGLALTDGNVWAASVTNGYTAGAVTRIPFDARTGTTVLLHDRPLYELASDGGVVWTLTGPHDGQRLEAVSVATGRVTVRRVGPDVGFLAADPSGRTRGLFAVVHAQLVRYGEDGSARRLAWIGSSGIGVPVVGLGSVWVPKGDRLLRLDPSSGRVLGTLRVPGALWLDVAVGPEGVFALEEHGSRAILLRVERHPLRGVARRMLPAVTGMHLADGDGALWLAAAYPAAAVWRIDPRTLALRRVARLP